MGELHLDVLVTRITKEMKIKARVGNPQVSYRESITGEAEEEFSFDRTIANKENWAKLTLSAKPLPAGSGNVLKISANTRDIPEEIIAAVKSGIEGAFKSGIKFGYETTDIEIDVKDIAYNELTSTPFANEACANMAFDAVCQKAGAVLMEPIMNVKLSAPTQYVGDVISSITSRGGIVNSMESRVGSDLISAEVPLQKMFGYTTVLRSSTQGRGTFSMEFSHYAPKA